MRAAEDPFVGQSPLVDGKTWTGFANSEEDYADQYVQQKMHRFRDRRRGTAAAKDHFIVAQRFAAHAVRDGTLITRQKQHSGRGAARTVVEAFRVSSMLTPPMDSANARTAEYYDRLASRYDSSIGFCERVLLEDGRQWAASRAGGDTLEIGIGTGRNLSYYPRDVRLIGVDISQEMLSHARARAAALGRALELRQASADQVPFADDSFDSIVATLMLCSVPDERAVLAEMARVLRPGGRLILVEHVRSPAWPVRLVEHLLEPLMVRFEHDHLLRDPLDHLADLGFIVETCERSKWGLMERLVARRTLELSRPSDA